ncbi:MAG: hypothetical protein FD180_3084 [Planctomycetota bacterium]|nr:MAG: hypothetical protein FD180_3084 [Planctomycetota bacterium]
MIRTFVLVALLAPVLVLALSGCGVSQSSIDEQLTAVKQESQTYADQSSANLKKDLDKDLGKRVYDLESNGAPRNWTTAQIAESRLKTLDDVDKKLAVLEKQLEEIKGRVDVVNMANKDEVMKVLTELQGMTVTLVQQLKTQRDALDQSIKQLEAIQVPEVPKNPK